MTREAVVEAEGLRRLYGGVAALDGVSLRAMAGESILLVGPNGAGKSTLLRTLALLMPPASGTLRLFGREARGQDGVRMRGRIGFLSHQTFLYDHLTAGENLVFHARLHGLERPAVTARATLADVGLEDRLEDEVRTLSRGMQQRAAIARSLLHQPDLLLLDEPFTGLDPQGAGLLRDLLRRRISAGVTCLIATHDLPGALPLATRVVALARGRIALDREVAGFDTAGLEAACRDAVFRSLPGRPA